MTMCAMTHERNEEQTYILTWILISDDGSTQKLTSGGNGGKYAITQTNEGTKVKSQLIINSLDSSDKGSYFCQATFSNGTSLPRSQEINLFERLVYNDKAACNTSRVESTTAHRCVMFKAEVVLNQLLPCTEVPSSASTPSNTTHSLTTVTADQVTTTNTTSTMDGGKEKMATTFAMAPRQPKQNEGEGENTEGEITVPNILLYAAIGAVILLVLLIIVLVIGICLCNRACDCCQLCS